MQSPFRTVELSDPQLEFEGLRWMTVASPALGRRADLTLFIPQPVAAPPPAQDSLPIIILMHGVFGSHWAWALKGAAHRTAARLINQREIPPCVIAMPSDGLWGDGSGYVPHADANYESWILDEVPAAVRIAAPITSETSPLFLAGLSMGGFGALRLGAKYRSRVSGMSGHSSVTDVRELDGFISQSRTTWSPAPVDQSVLAAMTLNAGPLPPFRFDCGTEDKLLEANRSLHRALNAAGIAHIYEEFPGAHEWPYWEQHLADTLHFFANVLQQSPPRTASPTVH